LAPKLANLFQNYFDFLENASQFDKLDLYVLY